MAFTIPLTFEWFKHRLYAAQRILYQQQPTYFIDKNPILSPIVTQYNTYILCPICGFSIANLMLKEGWSVRACSAIGFRNIINNSNVDQWLTEVLNNKESSKSLNNNRLSIK